MEDYEVGKVHIQNVIRDAQTKLQRTDNVALVSLGDLGESKNCDHNPDNPFELFAGTTQCHEMAANFLSSFNIPYEVIAGNHDLEGIDEFPTDASNLNVYLRAHGKETPQFVRQIAEKTLLVGLCSTVFREAKYTSHEVIIDEEQIRWFEDLVKSKPADDGWYVIVFLFLLTGNLFGFVVMLHVPFLSWPYTFSDPPLFSYSVRRIFVFSHAPPNGSGIRIIQENHVVNGCCWLNHSDEKNCRKFIEIVREHRCIKVRVAERIMLEVVCVHMI